MRIIFIRKKFLYIILISALILILLVLSLVNNRYMAIPSFLTGGKKIIGIDPGHGGIDPGAIGVSGTREDEINLSIALELKKIFEEEGFIVILTREDEKGLYTEKSKTIKEKKTEDLKNRQKIIEKGNCDLLLSIHLNSFSDPQYYGAQTFYKKDCEKSKKLAYMVQSELKDNLDKENNRMPQEREEVFLINDISVPAILVECGFLSNSNEEELLKIKNYQNKLAEAIYTGVNKYYDNIENNKNK